MFSLVLVLFSSSVWELGSALITFCRLLALNEFQKSLAKLFYMQYLAWCLYARPTTLLDVFRSLDL